MVGPVSDGPEAAGRGSWQHSFSCNLQQNRMNQPHVLQDTLCSDKVFQLFTTEHF